MLRMLQSVSLLLIVFTLALSACGPLAPIDTGGGSGNIEGEIARVTRVIDGDTIDVLINGREERVRYVGVNTPERDEVCYDLATDTNRALVEGQTVTLVRDETNRDRFDRLLRYIYVGDTLVNRELVLRGVAEAVLYEPDDRYFREFSELERQAARAGRGCHPTGIFDDGSDVR